LPECGGYKVHKDKLARLGVPIYTSHTILSANGTEHVESVTIAQVDRAFNLIPGTEKSFTCDSVLVAVGLNPVDEFYKKALEFGMVAFAAGDSEEIAEASAAIVSGKIKGSEITKSLKCQPNIISEEWYRSVEILKSKKGVNLPEILPEVTSGVFPVIHCTQEIPCDPCKYLCTSGLIQIDDQDIRKIPIFLSNVKACIGCQRCVAGCPGLAITLVDYRRNQNFPTVSIPFEFSKDVIQNKPFVTALDTRGNELGNVKVKKFFKIPSADNTLIVQVEASREYACMIAGFRIQDAEVALPIERFIPHIENDSFVCRCERVTAGEIRDLIRNGHRDLNEIKTITRAGMGACGSKTCNDLIFNLFIEEGIPRSDLKDLTKRPLFIEVPLKVLSGSNQNK
jgi:Fe-S-cluster-containing hydrogenase component 2